MKTRRTSREGGVTQGVEGTPPGPPGNENRTTQEKGGKVSHVRKEGILPVKKENQRKRTGRRRKDHQSIHQ